MPGRLEGKRILVTGASAGMGQATAMRMAADGAAAVAVHGRNRDRLEKVRRDIEAMGTKVAAYALDLKDTEKVRQLVRSAIADLGGLDVVISNAGDTTSVSFFEAEVSTIEYIFAVDFTAGFVLGQEAARYWRESGRGGVILYNAACADRGGLTHNPVYSAAKAALINLCKALAPALGPYGIRVNCVTPGFTERTRLYSTTASKSLAVQTELPKVLPLRRMGTPEDVAAAFAFLASDDASYITGANLLVEGGITAGSPSVPWREAIGGRLKYE